jgi:hypothetical protein
MNIFLSSDFVSSLSESTYKSIYLLIRLLSSLRLSQKVLIEAINSKSYRTHEIIELNSNLISTYLEAAKAYTRTISKDIFNLRVEPFDDYTKELIKLFNTSKNEIPPTFKALLFLRDSTTFHFHGEYIINAERNQSNRITYMGFMHPLNPNEAIFTNSIPHILEEIQRLTGKKYEEESITSFFKEVNTTIIFPFIDYIEKAVHDTVDDFLLFD